MTNHLRRSTILYRIAFSAADAPGELAGESFHDVQGPIRLDVRGNWRNTWSTPRAATVVRSSIQRSPGPLNATRSGLFGTSGAASARSTTGITPLLFLIRPDEHLAYSGTAEDLDRLDAYLDRIYLRAATTAG